MARRPPSSTLPPLPERSARQLQRYLLRGEHIVVAVHRHWVTVAEPIGTAVVGLVVVLWFATAVGGRSPTAADLALWLWFALLGRAVLRVYAWRREWFLATDRRLLLVYGFVVRKVAMMPLNKVTDMTYHRSVPGRLLGYGRFVLESAGQDQALSRIDHIPSPDRTYRAMISEIFRRDDDEPEPPTSGAHADDVSDTGADEEDPSRPLPLVQRIARRVAPRSFDRPHDDEPDTPATPGVQIYRSDAGPWGPQEAERDDGQIYRAQPTRDWQD